MYYLGGSQNILGVNVSVHSVLLGLEAGYGSKFGPLSLRGTVGIGNIETDASPGNSISGLYTAPNATSGSATVIATSVADSTRSGKATVSLTATVKVACVNARTLKPQRLPAVLTTLLSSEKL